MLLYHKMIKFTRNSPVQKAVLWLRNLPYRVRHVAAYVPILWNDYDFDQSFFYRLMAFKLGRMEKRMERFRPEVVKEIRTPRILCERIASEPYIDWGSDNYDR